MLIDTKQRLRAVVLPLARALAGAGVHPDQLTFAGLVAAALAGASLALGETAVAILWMLLSFLCDLLDGDVARLRNRGPSPFGAFFDSTSDRVAEALLFSGFLIGKSLRGDGAGPLWILVWALALTGGFLVSYTRARAEGLGLSCRIGVADRSVRMVLFIIMLLVGWRVSGYFLAAIALLNWYTVGERVYHVRCQTRGTGGPRREAAAPSPDAPRKSDETSGTPFAAEAK